jgi:hypothetical protein
MKDSSDNLSIIIIIAGFVLSVIVGYLTYTPGTPGALLDSIEIGLLTDVITISLGVFVELKKGKSAILEKIDENHRTVIKELVNSRFETLEALGINKHLSHDPKLKEVLYQLTEYYIGTKSCSTETLFGEVAKERLDQCRETLADLANGRFKTTESVRLYQMFAKIDDLPGGSINALTWLSQRGSKTSWWRDAEGKNYLEKQKKAIAERNVTITRIIIVSNQTNDDLKHLIEEQLKIGIQVKIIREDRLDKELRANFLICDDNWVTESGFDRHGKSGSGIISTNLEVDVAPRLKIWRILTNHPGVTTISSLDDVDYFEQTAVQPL